MNQARQGPITVNRLIVGELPTGDRLNPTAATGTGLRAGGNPGDIAVTAVAKNVI